MSTPMVTGTAAFLYSYRTDLHLSDIRKVLLETARKIPPLEGKLSSNGMLDVYAALNYGRAAENTAESAGTDNGGNADSTGADVSAAVGNTGNPESAQSGQETQSSGDTAQRESQTTTSKTITAGGGEPIRLGQ